MKNLAENLSIVALTLWVGGLWTIGYLVAPTLFGTLTDKVLAGALAGRMFTLIAYVGLVCGGYLLLLRLSRVGFGVFKDGIFWLVFVMLALTMAGHFGIQPILAGLKARALPKEVMESVFRDRFAAWHGISSILYLIQSVLGLWLAVKYRRG